MDYMPELEPPKTKAELEAVARKYNLHPSEYVPYPQDGTRPGDYPHLPDIGNELKDPNYPYDYPELKRNFNEAVSIRQIL